MIFLSVKRIVIKVEKLNLHNRQCADLGEREREREGAGIVAGQICMRYFDGVQQHGCD